MKTTIKLLTLLVIFSPFSHLIGQNLTEVKNIRFYEHGSSTINGGKNFGTGLNGSQSGYDFVNHTHYSSIGLDESGLIAIPYQNGEEANIDMVEHNGPFGNQGDFGFTSGVSTIWQGRVKGNNTTLWVTASNTFDYANASDATDLESEYTSGTPGNSVEAVQDDGVYISKIRNTNLYVAIKCYNVTNVTGNPKTADIFFDFDYKYGTLTTSVLVNSITVQGEGGASAITANNGTLQMNASVGPDDAKDKTVTWSVADGTGSATISDTGLLTAIGDGTVTVTATANDASNTTGSAEITISNQIIVLVNTITVQGKGGASAITANNGTLQMNASVGPDDAKDKTVTWSVADGTGSATISDTGLLTATGDGTVTVTATANDASNTTGSAEITISNQIILGINETAFNMMSVYPIPFADFITIDTETEISTAKIYSLDGSLIIDNLTVSSDNKINVSKLTSGTYILVLADGNDQVYTQKIIK